MSMQEYVRQHFSNKRIILVGNASFSENRSNLIDGHDVIVRFNFFNKSWFCGGLVGAKIDYWCVNLRVHRDVGWDCLCLLVKDLNGQAAIITPFEEDRNGGLADAKKCYEKNRFALIHPDNGVETGLKKKPSAGFYLAHRLCTLSIPFAVIGFTGITTRHHRGSEENTRLRSNPLVTFHETP